VNVILYAAHSVKESVPGFSNFMFQVMVDALLNLVGQHRVVVFGMPGHVKVDFAVDMLRHIPPARPLKRPE
jgi:hypothetical protein